MQKKTWLLGGAAVLAALALLTWAFMPRPLAVEVAQVVMADFEAGIEEDGRTRLRERYSVFAPLAGRLERLPWHEGDRVQAGQVLARIWPVLPPLLDARANAQQEARVASAQAALTRTEVRLSKSEAALAQAQRELTRTEQLWQQGFVAQAMVDQTRWAELAARKEHEASEQDRRVAQFDLAQARAALGLWLSGAAPSKPGASVAETTSLALRAPVNARVLRLPQLSETPVGMGALVMELGDTAGLEVVAQLLTTDVMHIAPGDPVRISRWGGPADLQARVRLVEPGAFTKVSALGVEEQRVNVVMDITSEPQAWLGLGDAYRVGVFIRTVAQSQALQVPLSAVFPITQAHMPAGSNSKGLGSAGPASGVQPPAFACYVVREGRAYLRPLHMEARNTSHAWVRTSLPGLETVKPGDQVVVYPPPNLQDGVRVGLRQIR